MSLNKIEESTENIIETKELFLYNGFQYLRVYKVTNGKVEMYWSNRMENEKITGYTFNKWNDQLKTVIRLYDREKKLKRILKIYE